MPVSRFGPLTTRGGVTFGLLTCNRLCTASNISRSISGGTATVTTPSLVAAAPGVHAELLDVIAGGEWPEPQTLTF